MRDPAPRWTSIVRPPDAAAATDIAAARLAEVRDRPQGRLELLRWAYTPLNGSPPIHLRYRRAALAFMQWQVRRGLLAPLDGPHPGSPWWRAVNERLLRDTCEARMRVIGHPGPSSSVSTQASVRFAFRPSVQAWYLAHNVTIVRGYLDNWELAEGENRVERFFINLVLARLLYAHALVAAPRVALSWLAPAAPWLGDPRRAMTGMLLSLARVLPDRYPLDEALEDYIVNEHTIGRLLDLGIVAPRLTDLYRWSARTLDIPELGTLVRDGTPVYAWDPADTEPWRFPPTRLARTVRRVLPPPNRAAGSGRGPAAE